MHEYKHVFKKLPHHVPSSDVIHLKGARAPTMDKTIHTVCHPQFIFPTDEFGFLVSSGAVSIWPSKKAFDIKFYRQI